jgi:cell division septal protein FtsQ
MAQGGRKRGAGAAPEKSVSKHEHEIKRRDDRAAGGPDRALALFMIAAAIIAGAALFIALTPSMLVVSRFEINGASTIPESELLSTAAVRRGDPFFAVNTARIRSALESDSRIASASVRLILPNILGIDIVERKPVATAIAEIDGRPRAVKIDSEGVVFGAASIEDAASVPVLSGIRFEGFRMGTRLPEAFRPLLSSLGEINAEEPYLLSAFSEIRIIKRTKGDPELVLFPIGSRIPIRTGSPLSVQTLRSMILVLNILASKGIADSVEELDFRSGSVVYRGKEDHSG